MNQIINIIQIILAISLSVLIFLQLQEKPDQTNLNTPPKTTRGWEKISLIITIILLFLFTFTSTLRGII